MDSLDRLSGSIAQIELLVASLKRENRDLGARLAQAAAERRQLELAGEARLRDLQARLSEAETAMRHDPGLEKRAQQAELEAADLARQLDQARRGHFEEKGRLEGLLRQMEAQVMAAREHEQIPTANPQALQDALAAAEAQAGRAGKLELDLGVLHNQLELAQEREAQAAQAAEALRVRQAELQKRITALESASIDLERQLADAQLKLAESAGPEEVADLRARLKQLEDLAAQADRLGEEGLKLEAEKAAMKKEKRELAAFAKERAVLRRKVEELVATLESARLG